MKHVIKWFENNFWEFLVGTLLSGVFIEFLNSNFLHIWIYKWPWTIAEVPVIGTGLITITAGWFLLAIGAFIMTLFYEELRTDKNIEHAWIIGWIFLGFTFEIFNSKIWQTWYYAKEFSSIAVIPSLGFSVFIPILGYGACGLISFWFIKYIMRILRRKGL